MRCAGRIQVRSSPQECGRRLNPEYKSNAKPSSFILLEYSGLIAKALPQKSRAGGFPPPLLVIFSQRKFLYKQQQVHLQRIGRPGRRSEPR
jgi:hypothetical protein